jgi:4-amino-4-deoxy-L-arabinose transferase-like glycosyltransferase
VSASLDRPGPGHDDDRPAFARHAPAAGATDRLRRIVATLRRRRVELGTLALIVVSYLLVYPVGEYVIEDEWAYVRSLALLHAEGTLRILDWNPMSLIGHLFWGALFTKLFGFSFTVTKISAVALLYVECLAVVALLRYARVREAWIWVAVLAIALNPLHFFHSFMYGTDIPALAWTALALLCYARGLDREGARQASLLVLGSTFGGLAFLVRQNGIHVHLALLAYLVLWERRRLRAPAFLLCAFGPAALIVGAFSYWYRWIHGPTGAYLDSFVQVVDFIVEPSAGEILRIAFYLCVYLGFFLLPLALAVPPRAYATGFTKRRRIGVLLVAAAAVTMLFYVAFHDGVTFPYIRNKITPFGYLRPNELILGDRDVLWSAPVSWVLSVAFTLAFLAFVAIPAAACDDATRRRIARLSAALLAVQLVHLLLTSRFFFDRHLLILCPTVVVLFCVLLDTRLAPRAAAFAAVLPFALYGIAGTHDSHAASRAAFQAGSTLVARGIHPQWIDGGYAFDGWYVYDRVPPDLPRPVLADGSWWVRSLFPQITPVYVIALSPGLDPARWADALTGANRELLLRPRLDRYRVAGTLAYRTYWPFGTKNVYVLVDRSLDERPLGGAP